MTKDEAKDEPCCYGGIAHDCHVGPNCRIVKRMNAATPPQRKPLTEGEIQDALEAEFLGSDAKRNWQDDLRVARAIEAAHGIKEES